MKIDLKTIGFKSGGVLRDFVIRRISAALARGADQLRRVVVRLLDENGPRGGLDKVCRVELVYHRGGAPARHGSVQRLLHRCGGRRPEGWQGLGSLS